MSFEISYATLRKPAFQNAYRKLMLSNNFPNVKAAYDVSRLGKFLDDELRLANDLFTKECERFVEKERPVGDKGEVKLEFKEGFTEDDFKAAVDKFHEHTVVIHRHKLPMAHLEKCSELTPGDLLELDAVVEDEG